MIEEKAKEEVLTKEGNNYFERNMKERGEIAVAEGCKLFNDFLIKAEFNATGKSILEIGCCYGYNLKYMMDTNVFQSGYGLEPSKDAVNYGNELYKTDNIYIEHGTADEIPFKDNAFDVVMVGFCWFWMDRKYLLKAVAEVDRVLKVGGILAIWDFDTKLPYIRTNIHNCNVPTYKMNLGCLFNGNPQYYLAEKRSYSHSGEGFTFDIQERCSLNVFVKENIETAYIKD